MNETIQRWDGSQWADSSISQLTYDVDRASKPTWPTITEALYDMRVSREQQVGITLQIRGRTVEYRIKPKGRP